MSGFVASKWDFETADDLYGIPYSIERVLNPDGPPRFAIRKGAYVMNKNGELEYEPMASSRDDHFYHRCRFSSFDEAVSFFESHNPFVNKG